MLQFVTTANEHHALGQALALCSISPSYVDSELGLVVPRILAAAQSRRILFARRQDGQAIVGFATYALLDQLSAQQWALQTRAPGWPDFQRQDGQAWFVDYVFEGTDAVAFADEVKRKHSFITQVHVVARKVDFVVPAVMRLGGANV